MGEARPIENHEELRWKMLLLWGPRGMTPAREAKQLLLARWGHSVVHEWWRSWTHSSFYVQLADTITHCEQCFSLTSSQNSVKREKGRECLAHMGKISPRLLAPAKYNSLELRGTLYCRENTQHLGYHWSWSSSSPFLAHGNVAKEHKVLKNVL